MHGLIVSGPPLLPLVSTAQRMPARRPGLTVASGETRGNPGSNSAVDLLPVEHGLDPFEVGQPRPQVFEDDPG